MFIVRPIKKSLKLICHNLVKLLELDFLIERGRRGRDHMVVGFTTTYVIDAYHHWCCEFESRWGRCVQRLSMIFDRSVYFSGSSTNKSDRHDIPVTEILLKVALNTTKQTHKQKLFDWQHICYIWLTCFSTQSALLWVPILLLSSRRLVL